MEWQKSSSLEGGGQKIPPTWIHIHYYEALNLLFRIENSLRVFAFAVLKTQLGSRWAEAGLSTDDSEAGSISSIGKKRAHQAKQFGYLGYMSPCPLLYLSMGELVQLMFSDAYWKHFADHFAGKRETMRLKLDEIIVIRNSFAHFRPLREDDVDVIRQNAKHALLGIEEYLDALTRCDDTIPTNSQEAWYRDLKTIGTDNLSVGLQQSSSGEWIKVGLTFHSPAIGFSRTGDWLSCKLVKLNSPAVLRYFSSLRDNLVCLTEGHWRNFEDGVLNYSKRLGFVFNRKVVDAHGVAIIDDFRNLAMKVTSELELLQQDDLARGELLAAMKVHGYFVSEGEGRPKQWSIGVDSLACTPSNDDPPEYWGDLGWMMGEFIATRDRYPWMPTSVSKDPMFFF